MIKQHKINESTEFIRGWYNDSFILDELISYHNDSKNKNVGLCYNGYDPKIKDSIDVVLKEGDLKRKYNTYLQQSVDCYIKEFEFCNSNAPWNTFIENYNIQYYKPGGAYHAWHCERTSSKLPISSRHLAFMTYLNDVSDGGETEFFYQYIKVKPEKGLTLIWPADWTFTHRGLISNTQEKYIITGWFNYID